MEPMYIYATPRQVTQWHQDQKAKSTQQTPNQQEPGANCSCIKEAKPS